MKLRLQAGFRTLKSIVGRRIVFEWIIRKAGIEEGQILPWWGVALNLMLFPSRIKLWICVSCYDVMSDTINTGTVRFPLHAVERIFGRPSPPGLWFRVSQVDNGVPVIECRDDCYYISTSNTVLKGAHGGSAE